MTLTMLLVLAAALAVILAGLAYLGHRRQRGVPAKIIGAAVLTLAMAGAWMAADNDVIQDVPQGVMPWLLVATGISGALFLLLVIDHVVIGEFVIERRGRYLPEVVRSLLVVMGLACVTLVLLHTVLAINVVALVALPTVATAVVGVALKDMLARFFSGLQVGKMVKVGDWVSMLDQEGVVTAIGAEHVSLLTRDQDLVMLPHDRVIDAGVKNFSRPTAVHVCAVTVSAAARIPPDRVCAVLTETAAAVTGVAAEPKPSAFVSAVLDSGLEYRLRFAIVDYSLRLAIESRILSYVWNAFHRSGIEIPFPQRVVHHAAETMAPGVQSLSRQQIFSRLRAVELFASLSDEQVNVLVNGAAVYHYLPGERVVRQGEPGQELFVIIGGTADVTVHHDGLVSTIATMEAGQFFGEISFLTGAARTSTVTATSAFTVLTIGREAIAAVMQNNEKLIEELSGVVARRQLVSQVAMEQLSKESQALALSRQQQSLMDRIRRYLWGRGAK